ncbi:AraC family transcriptional regulator [Faecalicatena contorta]|uniref:AraC-type DNA-binding protein n=1 Tax=Faecalicatena contorta TaxID=39482 RepID=A0A315ZRJ4_9FIRM|nr:AraC family transcriptional regulator [Faecalicatena contorta]PWJ47932.1 AraC family transcriptional regulator [Faecalicatena contorta]SUQ15695.1 AraC-type DNA-binding protein [Faecalicatena contorta]
MDKKKNQISDIFRDKEIPQLTAVYLIDETHNNKYARLFHSHDSELELYYVHSGCGYYMVENQLYAVKEGDMIICNEKVLHGDAPAFNNSMRSYCCALTNVRIKNLPNNCLIKNSTSPIVSCGSFAEKIGPLMELIFMLSLDFEQLYDVCSSMSISVLLLINQLLLSRDRHQIRTSANNSDAIVDKIKHYLDTHYTKPLSLESISKALNMTPNYVSHAFKAKMNISPIHYLLYRRFGEAQSLLMNTELTMAEISDLLGFSNPAHFSAMFKKHVGLSPVQYKRSIDLMNSKNN